MSLLHPTSKSCTTGLAQAHLPNTRPPTHILFPFPTHLLLPDHVVVRLCEDAVHVGCIEAPQLDADGEPPLAASQGEASEGGGEGTICEVR